MDDDIFSFMCKKSRQFRSFLYNNLVTPQEVREIVRLKNFRKRESTDSEFRYNVYLKKKSKFCFILASQSHFPGLLKINVVTK